MSDAFGVVTWRYCCPHTERIPADRGAEGERGSDWPEGAHQEHHQGRGEAISGCDEDQGGWGTEAGRGESSPEEDGDPGCGRRPEKTVRKHYFINPLPAFQVFDFLFQNWGKQAAEGAAEGRKQERGRGTPTSYRALPMGAKDGERETSEAEERSNASSRGRIQTG